MTNGQAQQDKFILNILKNKRNGYFLEIGSNDAVAINNTYLLEKNYGWRGIMIEYDWKFLPGYKHLRPNSTHVIHDATKIDYKVLFETNNAPTNVDYLQIDLEAANGSTIETLKNLDKNILDKYKFATITFEHDVYHTNFGNTRNVSREIFAKRGYVRVFSDVNNGGINPYEDWYVHPEFVDMNHVNLIMSLNSSKYVDHPITGKTINFQVIEYPPM
jgi:hypothetical protein